MRLPNAGSLSQYAVDLNTARPARAVCLFGHNGGPIDRSPPQSYNKRHVYFT